MERFRYKKSIPVPYNIQGYIYFLCINYPLLPADMKKLIREICRRAGGEYSAAVLEFVTTDHGRTAISLKHNMAEVTLERAVRKFYMEFENTL